jgi:hypothetical protein
MKNFILFLALIGFAMSGIANGQAQKGQKAPAKKTAKATTTTPSAPAAEVKPAAPRIKGPAITFNTEELNYGTIKKGSDPKRSFIITNTGTEPLIISSCSGSCGCTVPTCPREPIMPGSNATIDVNYDTQRVGAISKTVTVISNAVNEPTKVVRIAGTIEEI